MKLYPLDLYRDALVELVFSYLLVALATIAVFFRCWARRMKHVDLWIDDYSAISALFFLWILVAMQTAGSFIPFLDVSFKGDDVYIYIYADQKKKKKLTQRK